MRTITLTKSQELGLDLTNEQLQIESDHGDLKTFQSYQLREHLVKRFMTDKNSSRYPNWYDGQHKLPMTHCSGCNRNVSYGELVSYLNDIPYNRNKDHGVLCEDEVMWSKVRKQYTCPLCGHEGWLVEEKKIKVVQPVAQNIDS